MTRTKSAKALLVALLSLAIVIAFMPAMAQSSYAASKLKVKPSKKTISVKKTVKLTAKGLSAKQLKKVKWSTTKAGKKIVKLSASKGKAIKVTGKKAGKATITAKYGKKKAKATITVKAAATKTTVASVKLDKTAPKVGDVLTASLLDKDGKAVTADATYQWYRDQSTSQLAIPNATTATYTPTANDYGCALYVVATVSGKEYKSSETAKVADGYEAQIKLVNGHTAPQIGDKLTAQLIKASDGKAAAGAAYQWYAGEEKIASATSADYTVPAKYAGKTLKVEATLTIDGTETKFMSAATKEVVASTVPTAVKVTGESVATEYNKDGSVKAAGTPLVGDTLTAEFAAPEGAADEGATYQWYRNGKVITGQTAKTYTVTANDVNQIVTVQVKLTSDKGANPLVSANLAAAKNSIKTAEVTVKKTSAAAAGNKDAFAIKTVKLNGGTLAASNYTVEWYLGSADEKNKLYTNNSGTVAAAISSDDQVDYYLCDDPSATTKTYTKTSIVNKSLVAVVTGSGSYAGTAASAATDPVTVATALTGIAGDTADNKIQAGNTTIAPTMTPAKADVTYQWYSTKDETVGTDSDWTAISGATSKTYVPTAADATSGVNGYKLVIASANGYTVLSTNTSATLDVTGKWQDAEAKQNVNFTVENTSSKDNNDASIAQVGDVLEVTPSKATAASHLTYTWKYTDASGKDQTASGSTFTVPAVSASKNTIEVTAKSDSESYTVGSVTYGKAASAKGITVNKAISKVVISSDKTVSKNGVVTVDGVKNPVVGATLTATATAGENATYEWFADGKSVSTSGNTYTIVAADLGKTITCKVTGAGAYLGSEKTSDATGVVTIVGKVVLAKNAEGTSPIAEGTALEQNKTYYIVLVDANGAKIDLTDATGISYSVKTSDGISLTVSGNSFKTSADEVGKSITATMSGVTAIDASKAATDLTWTTDLGVE